MSNQEIENLAEKRADYKRVKTKMDRASRKAFLRRHFMWIVAIAHPRVTRWPAVIGR